MDIILGCKGFNYLNQREVNLLLERAIELGVFRVDTAPTYPTSERKIGNFLRRYPNSLHVSTKIFRDKNSMNAKSGILELESSLERLSVDCLQTLYIHNNMIWKDNSDIHLFFQNLKNANIIKTLGWCGLAHANLKNSIEFDVAMVRANPWDKSLSKLSLPFELKEVIGMNIFASGFWNYKPWGKIQELWRGRLFNQFNPPPSFYLNHPKRRDLEGFQDYKKLLLFAKSELLLNSVVIGTNNPEHLAEIVEWRKSFT
jgi:aryl-alcohol dehydrogenase-like predicted oxidoreductase